RLSGGEISQTLNECINELVDKMEAVQAGDAPRDEIRGHIIEVITSKPPVASSAPKAAKDAKRDTSSSTSHAASAVETVEDDNGSAFTEVISQAPSSSSKTPHPTANNTASAADQKPPIPTSISFNSNTRFEDELREVAYKAGLLDKLIKHKEELDKAKENISLEQKKLEAIKEVEGLKDMASFNEMLGGVVSSVSTMVTDTSTARASMVGLVRQTELQSRKEVGVIKQKKTVVDHLLSSSKTSKSPASPSEKEKAAAAEVVQKWFRNTKVNQAIQNATQDGYQKLQPILKASQKDVAEPNKELVELNKAKLEALEKKYGELQNLEKERLPNLEQQLEEEIEEQQNGSGDNNRVITLRKQVDECKKNTHDDTIKATKATFKTILGDISKADTAIKRIDKLVEDVSGTKNNDSAAKAVPFSLPILANGADSAPVSSGHGFNEALVYTRAGKGNHAMTRAMALRIGLNEFGSSLNIFEIKEKQPNTVLNGAKRSFLSSINGRLEELNGSRAETLFK
ncbi:MAG: hypothetical protein ACK5Q1_04805, partial [Limnobacter sp.]